MEENTSLRRSLRELKKLLTVNKIKIPAALIAKKASKKAKKLTFVADGNAEQVLKIVNKPTPDIDSEPTV